MNMLQIAGHTLGTPHQTVPEALRLFGSAGLDAAEVIWQDDYRSGIPETGGDAVLSEISRVSDDVGVPVIGLTPYMTGLNSLDDAERRGDIDRFRRCLTDAHSMGAQVIRVYAGSYIPAEDSVRSAKWEQLVGSLRELGPEAVAAGVTLVVENHFNTMTVSAAETVELMRAVDDPGVGILYDQANLTFTHCEDYPEAVAIQAPWIRHVHAKDLVFTDPDRAFSAAAVSAVESSERAVASRVVGDGILDWAAILSRVRAGGYNGYVSLEYEYRWHPSDLPPPAEGFRRGASRLRELMAVAS